MLKTACYNIVPTQYAGIVSSFKYFGVIINFSWISDKILIKYKYFREPHTTVPIQYTRVVKSLKYVGHVLHLETRIKPILARLNMVHGQAPWITGWLCKKRAKCTKKILNT